MDKDKQTSKYVDEVVAFAKSLLDSKKYVNIKDSVSIYTDSLADDVGRCHQVDVRAYHVS